VSLQASQTIVCSSALGTHGSGLQCCAKVPARLMATHRVLRGAGGARRQAVAGAGVLAAGAYGVHRLLTPRLMQWYRMWRHGEAPPASDAQPGRATAELVAAALKEQVGLAPASRTLRGPACRRADPLRRRRSWRRSGAPPAERGPARLHRWSGRRQALLCTCDVAHERRGRGGEGKAAVSARRRAAAVRAVRAGGGGARSGGEREGAGARGREGQGAGGRAGRAEPRGPALRAALVRRRAERVRPVWSSAARAVPDDARACHAWPNEHAMPGATGARSARWDLSAAWHDSQKTPAHLRP